MSNSDKTATPGAQDSSRGNDSDTILAEPMVVPLEQIHPYERNPRHGTNPEYDRIKASIREAGLDQPLTITQRPGAVDYIVHSGGNTRLLVLKELHKEAGDDRYATVPCLFRSWHRESDILLAHLRENDLRGDLTFIDKALAVFDIKALLEAELQIDDLSLRRLESALQSGGYALSNGLISRMRYAVQILLPLIPQALYAGLGRPQVQKIRALERAAHQIWQAHDLAAETAFDAVFATLCRHYDDPDWDTGLLRDALETEIAEQADLNVHVVRVELDALMEGRPLTIPPPEDDLDADSEGGDWRAGFSSTDEPDTPDPPDKEPKHASDPVEANSSSDTSGAIDLTSTEPDAGEGGDEASASPPDQDTQPLLTPPEGLDPPTLVDLKSLRARAWTLAARLARRNGLSDLIIPLSGQGLGFTLRDVPDPALADQLDEETLSQLSLVWWQLAACAELTIAPVSSITPHLPEGSILRQALEQQDLASLFNSVWTPDPSQVGHRLWCRLGDQDWVDLLNLMDSYRRIHRLADEQQLDLWAPA